MKRDPIGRRNVHLLLLLVFALFAPAFAAAQADTVFLVRHAERADTPEGSAPPMNREGAPPADPDLSAAGRTRAASLANMLKDAKITAIYSTQLKRAQQTAAPLAQALGLSVTTVPGDDSAALVAKIKAATGNVLVVGHTNTLPRVAEQLGVKTPLTIGETEYDNLFVVHTKTASLVRLHYK
jgi:broad specificity phosphatase PhoE